MRAAGILTFAGVAAALAAHQHTGTASAATYDAHRAIPHLSAPDLGQLQDGDIILVRGSSRNSRLILAAYPGQQWSHVGLLYQNKGTWMVVHATPAGAGGVTRERLSSFLSGGDYLAGHVFRVRASSSERASAVKYALRQARLRVPFDPLLDHRDPARQYCSELVWNAWKRGGADLIEEEGTTPNSLPFVAGELILPGSLVGGSRVKMVFPLLNTTSNKNRSDVR